MRSIIFPLLFILFQSHVRADLIIKPSDSTLTRDQFKSFVASCNAQDDSRVIGWRSPQRRDIPENDHDRVTIEKQNNEIRLRVRNLTTEDQGTWECIGMDASGRQIRKSFQLNIKVPITFHGDSIQYAALGEPVVIKCQVQATPAAEVSWFKGRDKNRIESKQYVRVNEGLRINRVDISDNETFWCRADVLETGESRDYPITVIISKSVTQPRITCATPCAIEKKTATLVCESTGLPPPKYSWYYGSADELRPVKDSPVGASEVPKFVVRGNQLTINYVDETDNGKYSCHAYNEYDRTGRRAEFNLNVIVPPRLSPIAPIEINLDEQNPQRVSFICRVERGSTESLTLEWQYLNNTPIQSTNGMIVDKSQFDTNKLIELRFDPVRREHFGNYSCIAKNLADQSYSMASLYIQFPPVFIGPMTQVVSTIPNYRVVMRCQFESYPPPQIQWIKMTRSVQDPEGRVLAMDIDNGVNDITTKQIGSTTYESVLSYTPSDRDFGLSFECRATNPRVGRHSFTLQRAEPPKKVRVTEVKPLTNGAEIVIQPPESGGLPLIEYVVKYDLLDKPDGESQTLTIPAQSSNEESSPTQVLKIEKIKPSTSYRFTIVAKSRAGIGQQAGPIQFRTLDRQIPEFKIVPNEENKNDTCFNDRSCVIRWTIESDGGAPIVRSEILFAKAKMNNNNYEPEGAFSNAIPIDSSLSEYEIKDLQPATNYIVLVKLYNEAGAAEQKLRVKTTREKSGSITATSNPLITEFRKSNPTKWALAILISCIVFIAIVIFGAIVTIRAYRYNSHKSNDPEGQLEDPAKDDVKQPMTGAGDAEPTSDRNSSNTGRSTNAREKGSGKQTKEQKTNKKTNSKKRGENA